MKNKLIYLDNAATSFPKPRGVVQAVTGAMFSYGNPGRGAHMLSISAAEELYRCRVAAAELFGAKPERVIFTSGATHSINMAINALRQREGALLISDLEHNSVLRPALASGRELRVFDSALYLCGEEREKQILDSVRELAEGAAMMVCTAASNVCGADMPIAALGKFCLERGILFAVDGAQAGGNRDINIERDHIGILCLPGHKGLLGPMGCGLMILGEGVEIPAFMLGGSGVDSLSPDMPKLPPERYEAGTPAVPLIAGLRAGIEFVKSKTPSAIGLHERMLACKLKKCLEGGRIKVYAPRHEGGTVLLNAENLDCEELASRLNNEGICVRAGLHCAPLAHKTLGSDGAVRISFGAFNTLSDVYEAASAIERLTK